MLRRLPLWLRSRHALLVYLDELRLELENRNEENSRLREYWDTARIKADTAQRERDELRHELRALKAHRRPDPPRT